MSATRGPGVLIGPAYTEVAGEPATTNQHQRLASRYQWAAQYVDGKTVVEVACGSGQGLGLMARKAKQVIGADYSPENLATARRTYAARIPLLRLDAHELPLRSAGVDVILLLETLYFLPRPATFIAEAARALRSGGRLLISLINKDTADFQRNPLYPAVFGAPELAAALRAGGFTIEMFGAFPLGEPTPIQRAIRQVKSVATRYNLMPGSMQAKVWLKRLIYGELKPLPRELHNDTPASALPVGIPPDQPNTQYQVLLASATKP